MESGASIDAINPWGVEMFRILRTVDREVGNGAGRRYSWSPEVGL